MELMKNPDLELILHLIYALPEGNGPRTRIQVVENFLSHVSNRSETLQNEVASLFLLAAREVHPTMVQDVESAFASLVDHRKELGITPL